MARSGEAWLSLEVVRRTAGPPHRGRLLMSVPKKVVRQAVKRNRIRRVLRALARTEPFFKTEERVFVFRVRSAPSVVNLRSVRSILGFDEPH